ncbi:hypothetical protein OTB20_25205 [Streptomyces sp. H27-H1]|uniref:hypothetical protein n=1 Tax=unclassified Streptomyces TaxID=2593676 RepID=UPI002271CB6E|nr:MULTISPECIES: hypothetical protein [unclassified Streptomyces]MCY0929437.1 hypothetical protein [Streptomyces sp. H27-H1]MCY0938347.1 hypothetical protein [Streptomyces sp. H34-S4]
MEYEVGTAVTPNSTGPSRHIHILGEVSGYATDPFTGDRLVAVTWSGLRKPQLYDLNDVIELD